ncbi:uncharacterized protein LOC113294842 [Papaver somniferum]|uniref:uncharacterized protein LOC113294842 n=1 Tax=Papaver somniferum TaxID=3469 RepID=UPI000E6F6BC9|nr:uncharacterized protein LOC113294842 [Papaver somniferum]
MEEDVVQDVTKLSTVEFNVVDADTFIWNPRISGQFSMKETYRCLSSHNIKPPWNCLVWFKNHIPRHSFISWLGMQKRLKTRNKLLKWGVIQDDSCILCHSSPETEDHLFHACPFAAIIWKGLLLKMGYVKEMENSWDEEIAWCIGAFKGTSCSSTVKKLGLNGSMYHSWREGNNRVFRTQFASTDVVSFLIVQEVRFKMSASSHQDMESTHARNFMQRWSIDCSFIVPDFIKCTWQGPCEPDIMINSDGSLREESGGFGAILRKPGGAVIVAASGGGPPMFVVAHEMQGLELGLKMAKKEGAASVHISIDSMVVYNLLTNSDMVPPCPVLQIWRRIKTLKTCFHGWKVSHCYKESNRVADYLAGLHFTGEWVEIKEENFSPEIKDILANDASQKEILRMKKVRSR